MKRSPKPRALFLSILLLAPALGGCGLDDLAKIPQTISSFISPITGGAGAGNLVTGATNLANSSNPSPLKAAGLAATAAKDAKAIEGAVTAGR